MERRGVTGAAGFAVRDVRLTGREQMDAFEEFTETPVNDVVGTKADIFLCKLFGITKN